MMANKWNMVFVTLICVAAGCIDPVNAAPCGRGSAAPSGDGCAYVWQCAGTGVLRVECTSAGCACSVTRAAGNTTVRDAPTFDALRMCAEPTAAETLYAVDITCGWNLCGSIAGVSCPDGGLLPGQDASVAAGLDAGGVSAQDAASVDASTQDIGASAQ